MITRTREIVLNVLESEMAFTDEQKLGYLKKVFCDRINETETLADMAQLVQNISPASVKSFLLSKLEDLRLFNVANATRETELAADIESLKDDVNYL